MKRIYRFILLIYFSLIFISCNKNPIVPIDTIKSYTVSGAVSDWIDPGSSPSAKIGAPVVLDNDTSISNLYGEYAFNQVTEGIHIISVLLPNYEPYIDTITVLRDTTIWIALFGTKEDYFPPIELNSQKKFKYGSGAAFIGIADSGEALWSFDSLKEENGNHIYGVKETLIFKRTIHGGNPEFYTIITQFQIIVDSLHRITIGLEPWDAVSFNRFYDQRLGEIIKLPLWYVNPVYIWVKKNIGLYKMEAKDDAHLAGIRYELIE